MSSKLYLAFEFIVLFGGVPAAIVLLMPGGFVLPVLWLFALVCGLALHRDRSYSRGSMWRLSGTGAVLKRVLVRFAAAAVCVFLIVLLLFPERLLDLPRQQTMLWLLVMFLYPLLSVLPQGIVYRAFLFHRYRNLLPESLLLTAGAFAFSVGHLPFGNSWALILTLIGGFFFGSTYLRSKSLLLSIFEHALYGCLIFTVGLGSYFVHGTRRLAEIFGG
jgi:membrane protease YdiL (CAAX protease family)